MQDQADRNEKKRERERGKEFSPKETLESLPAA